jgi:hypothetical protein
MNRKLVVLVLAAVLAVAIVVPSLAQTHTVSPRVSSDLSQRAMAMARTSLRTSREAKRRSRSAEEQAQVATGTANAAAAGAAATQAALEATHVATGVAAAAATTLEETLVTLPGGPSVTVKVPASGLIEVWAQATMDEAGVVALYEDGKSMPGQSNSESCSTPGGEPGLFSGGISGLPESLTLGTPASSLICATEGPPGPVLFQTTPGSHTYELRYASCGCNGVGTSPVTFSNRRLYVAPRP